MNEALNETAFGEGLIARGTHYLFGGKVKNVDEFVLREKELALKLALHPWILGVSFDWNSIDNMRDKFQTFVCIFLLSNLYLHERYNLRNTNATKLDQ